MSCTVNIINRIQNFCLFLFVCGGVLERVKEVQNNGLDETIFRTINGTDTGTGKVGTHK